MRPLALVLAALLLVAGCSTSEDEPTNREPSMPDIDTSQFAPSVRLRIDRMSDRGNCVGLQDEFDIADGNQNVELMTYIDEAMKAADCY